MYGWIIDTDFCYGPHDLSTAGKAGPMNGLDVKEGEGEEFELYDDDKNLMATGRIVGDYDGFEPLDDFGVGWYGATGIKYGGKWL